MKFTWKHLKRDTNLWSLFLVIIGLFISLPLLSLLIHLWKGPGEMWGHIQEYLLLDYIQNSILVLIGTGILSFLIGTSSAWIVSNYEFKGRKWIEWLLFFPLAIPSYIVAYAYVGLLGNGSGVSQMMVALNLPFTKVDMMNIPGLVWVLSISLYPYVYVGTRAMFKSFQSSVSEAAYVLGASKWRYFIKIALPLASPAIIGGLFLVSMEVLNDYGAAKYYGVNTFTTGIFRTWAALEDLPSAIYLSALLVLLVAILGLLVRWWRGKKSFVMELGSQKARGQRLERLGLKGRVLCYILLLIPLLGGLFLPLIQLFYWAMLTYEEMLSIQLVEIVFQTFGIAFVASMSILLFSLLLIYLSQWNPFKPFDFFKRLATIGYVLPGAIIGIGVIRSSQSIIDFFYQHFEWKMGYLIYGSSLVLIYAYVFRFLAVAFNPLEANGMKLGRYLSESSYLLGGSRWKTLWQIDRPLLRKALLGSFLLCFIDVMKELPLTLILKPYTLQTLAVKAYEYADDERVAEAAIPALLLIGTVGVILLGVKYMERRVE